MVPVVFVSVVALFRATLSSSDPLVAADAPRGPEPLGGLWAALPADCAPPRTQKIEAWPACAVPLGFVDGEVAALRRPDPDNPPPEGQFMAAARTRYRTLAPSNAGEPELVQLDIPLLFNRTTIYLALEPDIGPDGSSFSAATGWPVGCPAAEAEGVVKDGARCVATTLDGVRLAARLRPPPEKLYRLVRVVEPTREADGPTAAPDASPVLPPPADAAAGLSPPAGPAAPTPQPPSPM